MILRYRSGSKIQNIIGPSGTGKTVLAKSFFKAIAEDNNKPIEIDGRTG